MNSVYIRRAANTTGLPDEYVSGGKNKVGSCSAGSGDSPLTGLTEAETEAYMPKLLGIQASHADFMLKVNAYFWDIAFDIPAGATGLKLNINIRKNEEGEDETVTVKGTKVPVPENLVDFIRYKYLLAYPDCANTEEESLSGTYRMFIFDENIRIDKEYSRLEQRRKASAEYLRVAVDRDAVDQILLLFSEDVEVMDSKSKDLALERYANEMPEIFYKRAKDKNIVWKAKIKRMVTKGIIEQSGNTFLFGGETVGYLHTDTDPYKEVVIFLKDKANSATAIRMFAKLGEDVPETTLAETV